MGIVCSNTIYKGTTEELEYVIDEEFSNLYLQVYTDGKTYVIPTATTIDEGVITMVFEGDDLDILNDGVLRYDVQYDNASGETIVNSVCTNLYLKTPGGYSATTAEEIYQEGYSSGYTDGQSDCPECDCSSAITEAYQSGFTEGKKYSGVFFETEVQGIRFYFSGQQRSLAFQNGQSEMTIDDKVASRGCSTEIQGSAFDSFVWGVREGDDVVVSKVEFGQLTSVFDSVEDFGFTDLVINCVWHPRIVSQTKRTEGSKTYIALELATE